MILDPDNLTNIDKANKQCNTMALNTIYNAIDSKVFGQIKDCERASEVWKRLEETYEGTPVVKSAVGVLTPIPLRPVRSSAQGVKKDLVIKQDPGRLE